MNIERSGLSHLQPLSEFSQSKEAKTEWCLSESFNLANG